MKIGFVGLGKMGEAIAQNLLAAGHVLTVFNRTRSRAESIEKAGAVVADNIAATCAGDFVFSMLSDDTAVRPVADEILQSIGPNTIHISLSTISTQLSRDLSQRYTGKGRHFISAPVFGRPPAARSAQLLIVVAGEAQQIEKVMPTLESMGRKVIVVGDKPEQANLIKLSGNFMIASILEAMGEACALIRKSGMKQQDFVEIICDDLFPSPILKAYGPLLSEDRFTPAGFAMELGLKDIRLVLDAADDSQAPMPLASLLHDNFLSGVARGKGQSDWSALAELACENAGISTAPGSPNVLE